MRLNFTTLVKAGYSLMELAQGMQTDTPVAIGFEMVGLQSNRLRITGQGCGILLQCMLRNALVVIRLHIIGLQRNGPRIPRQCVFVAAQFDQRQTKVGICSRIARRQHQNLLVDTLCLAYIPCAM